MTRYLAIDYGGRRTGLAVGDDLTGQAGPVDTIEATDDDTLLRALREAVDAYDADALVLGIPYNMDGSAGPAASKALALADRLERELEKPVHRVDERLTSFAADEAMKRTGLTRKRKKARRDALAAAAILRDFLNSQTGSG